MQKTLVVRDRAKTMALFAAFVGATLFGGCAVDPQSSQPSTSIAEQASTLPPVGEDTEYAFFNNGTFTFQFPGFFTPQAETFFIWNLGTSIQHGAPYPSSSHDRLYGVVAPGPAGATHHVDGQEAFDHYHVMSKGTGTRTFDVFLVFTGPNFNAATFKAPLSEKKLNEAIAAGILNPPTKTTDLGFPGLVIKVPVREFEDQQ